MWMADSWKRHDYVLHDILLIRLDFLFLEAWTRVTRTVKICRYERLALLKFCSAYTLADAISLTC